MVYLKEGFVRKSVLDYGYPNLNNSYDEFSKIALDFALEKKWKAQQYMAKYQPYFCSLDQKWLDRALRDSIRAKKARPELLKPLVSSYFTFDGSLAGYSNFHRINILLFLNSVNLTTLKTLEYSLTNKLADDEEAVLGSDKILQLNSLLIRSGQQRLFPVGINSKGYVSQVESIDFEKKLSDEVAAFLKHLITHTFSERERKILFEEHPDSKHENKKKAVLEGIQALEDMIKKKNELRNQSIVYQKAVSIGTIKYEFKTSPSDYSIEKEGSLSATQLSSSTTC